MKRAFAAVVLAFSVVGGCAADHAPGGYSARDRIIGEHVLNVGYSRIAEIYLQPVDLRLLTIDGLNGLMRLDPTIGIALSGSTLQLKVSNSVVGEFALPDRNDPGAWAAVTMRAVERLRATSPGLGAAGAEDVYQAMFDSIVTDLDGYSRYAGAARAVDERSQREGYGGIGVTLRHDGDRHEVIEVLPDGPAAHSGITRGDLVLAIDGDFTAGLSMEQVGERLRGPAGTTVMVTVGTGVGESRRIAVRRDRLIPNTVEASVVGDIGILKVERFNAATTVNLREGIRKIRRELGRDPIGIALDLRGNPGGLLDQAVAVADQFMPSGRIVSTKGRHPDSLQRFDATPDDIAGGIPMTVLIDGRTASAAEIVAAALQDSGRAVVVGASSFGKGSVQTVTRLPNDGELFLTWSRIYAPSGYTIHRQGVQPTVCTSNDIGRIDDALRPLRTGPVIPPSTLALWRTRAPEDETALNRLREVCPWKEHSLELDLQVAGALLKDPPLYRRALLMAQTHVAER